MKSAKSFISQIFNSRRSFYLMVGLLLISTHIKSQSFENNPTQIKEIPPAPAMWEFQKYGDYPVSMHTGVPNISVPLGNVQSGMISVPLSVNYHSSGVKVDQKASLVGLGWSLKAGGTITRTIRGIADEVNSGYINIDFESQGSFDPATIDNYYKTFQYMEGGLDSEPDIFYYEILGYSGKFIFKPGTGTTDPDTGETKAEVVLIPHNDLKVTPVFVQDSAMTFKIVTPEGIQAEFSSYESSHQTRKGGLIQGERLIDGASTWHLTKLLGPNDIDEITFDYELVADGTGHVIEHGLSMDSETINYYDPCWSFNYTVTPRSIIPKIWYSTVKKIKRINFKNGYVLFNNSSGNRIDDPNDEELRLDSVEFYSRINNVDSKVKSYEFEYDYFGTVDQNTTQNSVRLKLDKIYATGSDGSQNNPHQFFYKDGPSGYEKLPSRYSKSQDFWGYYNGKGNASLAPKIYYEVNAGVYIYIGDADRDINTNYAQAGIIEKIVYPTLGSTEFEFENNTATILSSQYVTGGLRIKNITNFDSDESIKSQKSYDYVLQNDATKSSGVYNGGSYISDNDYKRGRTNYFDTSNNNTNGSCPPVIYPTTYTTNSVTVSSTPSINNNLVSSFYQQVKEYNGSSSDHKGYTWYYYAAGKDTQYQGTGPIAFSIDKGWDRGQLLKQEVFENGNLDAVKTITNTYANINSNPSAVYGFKAGTRYDIPSTSYVPIYNLSNPYTFRSQLLFLVYYSEPVVWKRLASTTTVMDGITTVVDYSYNTSSKHINPIKEEFTSSEGKQIETKTYYTKDIIDTSSLTEGGILTPYELNQINKLKDTIPGTSTLGTHQLNLPIQKTTIINGNITSVNRTLFDDFDGFVLPDSIRTAKGALDVEGRVDYSEYKNGKLIEVKQVNGPSTYYIWGYNNSLPIAKIENPGTITSSQLTLISNAENKSDLDDSEADENTLRTYLESLRSGFPNSLVTTYTYDPLVGVTSMTDPAGYTTFYQYNTENRLEYVINKDEKVVKSFDYNHKQIIPQYTITSTSNGNGSVSLSDTEVNEGENVIVTVTPNSGYQISTITVNGTSHSTSSPFTLSNITNNTIIDVQFSVIPPSFSVSPTSMSFDWIDGNKTATVTAGGSWTVSKSASWITISATSGSGNGTFTIRPTKNNGSQRSGTVTVTQSGTSKTIYITQSAGDSGPPR